MVKRGLGRGLSSLIPSLAPSGDSQLEELRPSAIVPNINQPRKYFDPEAFEELVSSISKHGLIQPIVVRPIGDGYELVAGERRWRAAKEAGLKTVPAIVRRSDDCQSLELALIENLQRENLNAIEEAIAYQHLIDEFEVTQTDLAERLGKNRTTISNTIRLLQLGPELREAISAGQLSSGHARALLTLDNPADQERLAAKVITEGLSVRQTENLARLWQVSGIPPNGKPALPDSFKAAARRLRRFFGTKVKIKMGRGKGKLEIEFSDQDDLDRIMAMVFEPGGD